MLFSLDNLIKTKQNSTNSVSCCQFDKRRKRKKKRRVRVRVRKREGGGEREREKRLMSFPGPWRPTVTLRGELHI